MHDAETTRSVVRRSWALLVSMAMLMAGAGLQGSLLGVRAPIEGFSVPVIGAVLASYYAGFVIGSLWVPKLIRSVGHIRSFTGLASLASVTMLVHGVWISAVPWFGLRLVTGLSIAGLFVVVESWLSGIGTPRSRGTLLAVYMVVVTGSLTVGQLLLGTADVGGPVLFVLASALVSLAVVPMSLVAQPTPLVDEPQPVDFRWLVRSAPLALVAGTAAGMGVGALLGFGAVVAGQLGFGVGTIALFVAAIPAGSAIMQIPIGRLSDRSDRRRVIALVGFTGSAVAAVAAVGSTEPRAAMLVVLAGVLGGLVFPLYSLGLAHLNDYLGPGETIGAGVWMILVNGVGAAISPVAVSVLVEAFGPEAFWWYLAVLLGTVGAYSSYRITRRGPAPEADRAEFSPVPPALAGPAVELEVRAAHPSAGGRDRDAEISSPASRG